MSWDVQMTLMVRTLISDLDPLAPTYTDDRIKQVIVVAATYVQQEANLTQTYAIDISSPSIVNDPTIAPNKDEVFVGLTCLKSACLLDQSTFRTKAAVDGVRASLGSASIGVSSNLSGFKTILDQGPCAMYESLLNDFNIGNASAVRAVLGPFVSNDFDPVYFNRAGAGDPRGFYG